MERKEIQFEKDILPAIEEIQRDLQQKYNGKPLPEPGLKALMESNPREWSERRKKYLTDFSALLWEECCEDREKEVEFGPQFVKTKVVRFFLADEFEVSEENIPI